MDITINDTKYSCEGNSAPLTRILKEYNLPDKGIAIAINNTVVRKILWKQTTVHHGDSITVIKAVCGG